MVDYSDNAGGFLDNFDDWEYLNFDTPSVPGQSGFMYDADGFEGYYDTEDDCAPKLPTPDDCK